MYYVGGGFALVLFCALWFFDRPPDLDEVWQRRVRRRAHILTPLGLLHPVIALTALGLARDVAHHGDPSGDAEPSWLTVSAATTGLVISLAIMCVVVATTE